VDKYFDEFNRVLNAKGDSKLWVLGRQTDHLDEAALSDDIRIFRSIKELSDAL
jgi:hypothetical protein